MPGAERLGDDGRVGTIQAINFGTGGPVEMRVKNKTPPNRPAFNGPLLVDCTPGAFTKIALTPTREQLPVSRVRQSSLRPMGAEPAHIFRHPQHDAWKE